MTGFGQQTVCADHNTISVEVRTVNHRFFDLSLKMPRTFNVLEEQIKKIIKRHFVRGRIEVYLGIDGNGLVERQIDLDWSLLEQSLNLVKEIKQHYPNEQDLPLALLPKLEDVFVITEIEKQTDKVSEAILTTVDSACEKAKQMRITEGDALIVDILERMDKISMITNLIHERREIVNKDYYQRIVKRIQLYTTELELIDEQRIYQEIALLAEKGDISEEIIRLHSHITQFVATGKKAVEIGRKLEFILQEMLREANTIGSKANDPQISNWVVDLKTEIEKIKEQIQNIE